MASNWEVKPLSEILDINPTLRLPKGIETKKVAMEYLTEFTKKIRGYEISPFTSGSKFQNGDTLMARITPCLENGKTAFVDILEQEEVGFGSTEYFVLRAKKDVSDAQFIYYLSISDEIRTVAIKSMTGTSGRQRAQKEALLEYKRPIPSLKIQKKIGNLLSLFDKKIENNKSIINSLQKLGETLFKRWFIDFEFQNEQGLPYRLNGGEMVESELGEIPKSWYISNINKFAEEIIITGKTPSTKIVDYFAEQGYPFITIPDMHGNVFSTKTQRYLSIEGDLSQNKKRIPKNSLLVSCIATPGLVNITSVDSHFNQQINAFTPRFIDLYYLYFSLKNLSGHIRDLGSSGSTTLNLNKSQFSKIQIVKPTDEILEEFTNIVHPFFEQILNLTIENQKLSDLRDTLLPKLLSSEIEIPDESVVESNE